MDTAWQNKADTSSVYTKTESDALLQNNDPRKWGLGADSILVDSLDNALETGWYKSNGATPASGYWNCLTERYNSQSITQTAVQYDNYGASIARRMMSLGVFGPWEYVNPPMILGVEYRTTERYRGKPVYQKLIDFGALPNNTQKSVSIFASGETNTMECGIDVKLISHANQAYKTLDDLIIQVLQNGAVTLKTNYDESSVSVYALCYYTKTTD